MITVGQIVKPQGIRGEVKVRPLTSDPSRFCVLKSVCVGGKPYRIEKVRVSGGDVYLTLLGVNDRNGAEELRGAYLEINRASAVSRDDGEYFIADLMGARLVARRGDASEDVGIIENVQSFGAADVFSVKCHDGKDMSFAFVKALLPDFDAQNGVMTVDGKKLDEVAVYED